MSTLVRIEPRANSSFVEERGYLDNETEVEMFDISTDEDGTEYLLVAGLVEGHAATCQTAGGSKRSICEPRCSRRGGSERCGVCMCAAAFLCAHACTVHA